MTVAGSKQKHARSYQAETRSWLASRNTHTKYASKNKGLVNTKATRLKEENTWNYGVQSIFSYFKTCFKPESLLCFTFAVNSTLVFPELSEPRLFTFISNYLELIHSLV